MDKKAGTDADLSQAGRTLGTKGGQKGGPARAENLTAAQRQQIASKGGKAAGKKK